MCRAEDCGGCLDDVGCDMEGRQAERSGETWVVAVGQSGGGARTGGEDEAAARRQVPSREGGVEAGAR